MATAGGIALKQAKAHIRETSGTTARDAAGKRWSKLRMAFQAKSAFTRAASERRRDVSTMGSVSEPLLRSSLEDGNQQRPKVVPVPERRPQTAPPQLEQDEDETPLGDFGVLKFRIVDNPIKSVMFVTVPLGIFAKSAGWPASVQFWLNFCALIPLSTFLGNSTEDLASYTSQIVAGLLNATFGNVVEMMVTFMALMAGQLDVVKATLLGSILSNLLFVLGSCFLYGGYRQKELTFCSKAASTCTSLLLLAIVSLVMPTFLKGAHPEEEFLNVSRYSAVVMFFVYLQFLAFQLVTHADYFNPDEEEEEEDEPKWSMGFAVAILGITSVITAFSSDALVDSITDYSKDMSLNRDFIGLILVASVGNIPEFYVTLMVAQANKIDLALTIAVGSSCQMALFVTPFCVLVGWFMDVGMSLNFHPLQVISVVLAVLVVSSVIQGGSATWLQGSLLVSSYLIIGMIFFFLPLNVSV